MVHQLERGENGNLHVQGYVHFSEPRTGRTLQGLLGFAQAHVEPRMGSHSQARAYCMKEDTRVLGPWEYGISAAVPEGQGDRGWGRILQDAVRLTTMEMYSAHPREMVMYFRGIQRYRLAAQPPRSWAMEVTTVVGPSGVGKSRYALDREDVYVVPEPKGSGLYWDGYDGQNTVVFDDMSGRFMTQGSLLRLLDRYPFQVGVHGGQLNFVSRRIIFTSNKHPKEWYQTSHHGGDWESSPLRRRLTEGKSVIYHMVAGENLGDKGILKIEDSLDKHWRPPVDDNNNNNNEEEEEMSDAFEALVQVAEADPEVIVIHDDEEVQEEIQMERQNAMTQDDLIDLTCDEIMFGGYKPS